MTTVTSPLLPPLEEFHTLLEDIWQRKWVTNNGYYHQKLEEALQEYLGVPYISLFTNGTLPIITALQALNISGEVITTPYSFVATSHALWWNGITPVFTDIDPRTGNIDPQKIEAVITDKTTAIMPVHVYGNPCDTQAIEQIANKYGLKVIYDAAHAFGVKVNGESILYQGDISTLSFHATKTYNTIEGGALICKTVEMKEKIDHLKNFGFESETEVVAPGINGKMDEIRAAYGLLSLNHVDKAIEIRKKITHYYRSELQSTIGIRFFEPYPNVEYNYSYFPIFIDKDKYGISRDTLYQKMKEKEIYGRRYFYPLISDFDPYKKLPSASIEHLPIANQMANQVICLPLHHELRESELELIVQTIKENKR